MLYCIITISVTFNVLGISLSFYEVCACIVNNNILLLSSENSASGSLQSLQPIITRTVKAHGITVTCPVNNGVTQFMLCGRKKVNFSECNMSCKA